MIANQLKDFLQKTAELLDLQEGCDNTCTAAFQAASDVNLPVWVLELAKKQDAFARASFCSTPNTSFDVLGELPAVGSAPRSLFCWMQ